MSKLTQILRLAAGLAATGALVAAQAQTSANGVIYACGKTFFKSALVSVF